MCTPRLLIPAVVDVLMQVFSIYFSRKKRRKKMMSNVRVVRLKLKADFFWSIRSMISTPGDSTRGPESECKYKTWSLVIFGGWKSC